MPSGSLLLGTRVGVGKAVVNDIDIAISQDLTGAVLDTDLVHAMFAAYFFKSSATQAYLAGRKRGTTIQGVSRFDLDILPIALPPLPEQRTIARVLRVVQAAKDARERELELERERKAALMANLFTHGTRGEATKQTKIGEMPSGWKIGPLSAIAKIQRGKFAHRPRNAPEFYGGLTPFIQTGDVTAAQGGHITQYSQTLNVDGLAISKLFPKDTIVITIAANIGYTAILDFDSAFPDSLIGITPADYMDRDFLNYYLGMQQPEMDRLAPKGTQKNINIEFLAPWPVAVPPLLEQQSISAILEAADRIIGALERETYSLQEIFLALLEELMTGRIKAPTLP